MGCFGPDKPKNLNYADILRQTLQTQMGLEPSLLGAEAQYSPIQTNLTLQNMNDLLFGSQGGQFDVQTYTPSVFQQGKKIFYGGTPKGYTGDVNTQPLPYWGTTANGKKGWVQPTASGGLPGTGQTFDAATGQMIDPRRPQGAPGSGIGLTGSTTGDATLLGTGPFGASIGSMIEHGNPDPISGTLGIGLWGNDGPPKIKLQDQQYGTRTVTQGGQRGLVDLMNQVNSATRASNVNDIATMGPDAVQALLASNPDAANIINELNRQALEGLDAGTSLTDEEKRLMEQAARASWAARGMGGSDASAADEVLRQFALGQNLQGQRRAFAANTLGADQSYLQNPMLSLLTSNAGGGANGQAQSLLPSKMFNPESPYAGNLAAANQQMAALFADPSTLSKINMVSDTTGKILSNVGQIAGIAGGI